MMQTLWHDADANGHRDRNGLRLRFFPFPGRAKVDDDTVELHLSIQSKLLIILNRVLHIMNIKKRQLWYRLSHPFSVLLEPLLLDGSLKQRSGEGFLHRFFVLRFGQL